MSFTILAPASPCAPAARTPPSLGRHGQVDCSIKLVHEGSARQTEADAPPSMARATAGSFAIAFASEFGDALERSDFEVVRVLTSSRCWKGSPISADLQSHPARDNLSDRHNSPPTSSPGSLDGPQNPGRFTQRGASASAMARAGAGQPALAGVWR
jgi:hypothetical protein